MDGDHADARSCCAQFGLDPTSEEARRAIEPRPRERQWEYDDQPYFDGEVEPCINGQAVAIGAYFGQDVRGIVDRLLTEQMDDGGWNCEQEKGSTRGSFETTIDVLEGLLEYERATGAQSEVTAARMRGAGVPPRATAAPTPLDRRGGAAALAAISPSRTAGTTTSCACWTISAMPGVVPDDRMAEAIGIVESKRDADGRWPLEHAFHDELLVDLGEREDQPSRWITLRALRVLRWWEEGQAGAASTAGSNSATA